MSSLNSEMLNFKDLISSIKNTNKKSFLEMKDIYPNYNEFEEIKNKLTRKAIESYQINNNENMFQKYTYFLEEDEKGKGIYSVISNIVFFVISAIWCLYFFNNSNTLILDITFGIVSIFQFISFYFFYSYCKKEKEAYEILLKEYLTPINQKILKDRIETYKILDKEYLKKILYSPNEYINLLKDKYIDEMNYVALSPISNLKENLEVDLKNINLQIQILNKL